MVFIIIVVLQAMLLTEAVSAKVATFETETMSTTSPSDDATASLRRQLDVLRSELAIEKKRSERLEEENVSLKQKLRAEKVTRFFSDGKEPRSSSKRTPQETGPVRTRRKIISAAKDVCAKSKIAMTATFSNQLILAPLPESPFVDDDTRAFHDLLVKGVAGTIKTSATSARKLSTLCRENLANSFKDFAEQLRVSTTFRESMHVPTGSSEGKEALGSRHTAPGALRLAEDAQIILSNAFEQISAALNKDFLELELQFSERGETFVSIEMERLGDLYRKVEYLRKERDAKLYATIESKRSSRSLDKHFKQKSHDASEACRAFEVARFRYARRANHVANSAANDVTGRCAQLVELLRKHFEHAASIMRRIEPEIHRVRELAMDSAIKAVSDDGLWIDRNEALRAYFESSGGRKGGLPSWNDSTVYERPPRRYVRRMGMKRISDVSHMGWLLKVANKSFPGSNPWRRRWFWIDMTSGALRYMKNSSRVNVDVCNLALTTVRRCTSKLHSFELISPTFNGGEPFLLQAETDASLEQWIDALHRATATLLSKTGTRQGSVSSTSGGRSVDFSQDKSALDLYETLREKILKQNPACADCGKHHPEWASINLGIVICIKCAGVHRTLGVQISQVRSVRLDHDCWDDATLAIMSEIGNTRSNGVWGATMTSSEHIGENADRHERERFIREKYVHRRWVAHRNVGTNDDAEDDETTKEGEGESVDTESNVHFMLQQAAVRGDTVGVLRYMARGGDISCHIDDTGQTALHLAAKANALGCVVFLLRNGASPDSLNSNGVSAYAMISANSEDDEISDTDAQKIQAMVELLQPSTPGLVS